MAETPQLKRPEVVLDLNDRVIVYANNVQLETNPWDFRFRFRRIGDTGPERVHIEELAVVYLSPPQAKAFLSALAKQIALYEAQHGPIPATGAAKEGSKDSGSTEVTLDAGQLG